MNNELINEVKKSKTPDELIAIAKEKGITLTPQNAEVILQRFGVNREVADDELDNVSGGCGGSSEEDAPAGPTCPNCGGHLSQHVAGPYICDKCGANMIYIEGVGYLSM